HRLLERYMALLLQRNVRTNLIIDNIFYCFDFIVAHLGKMRNIEAQNIRGYQRAFLIDVITQNFFERSMKQVRSRMIAFYIFALLRIDLASNKASILLGSCFTKWTIRPFSFFVSVIYTFSPFSESRTPVSPTCPPPSA